MRPVRGFTLVEMLVVIAIIALLAALLRFLGPSLEHPRLLQVLNLAGSLAGAILVFALIYKFLPETSVAWRDVWAGAVAGALLFVLGQSAIGWYLAGSTLRSVYGAAGSLAVLLVWIYYSAQILYLGAALTCACAQRRRHRAS